MAFCRGDVAVAPFAIVAADAAGTTRLAGFLHWHALR
jgi:hypothetical protein